MQRQNRSCHVKSGGPQWYRIRKSWPKLKSLLCNNCICIKLYLNKRKVQCMDQESPINKIWIKITCNFSQIFKRVFLETTFFNTFDMISQVLMNRLTWNLAWTFFIYPSIVQSRIMWKFWFLLFLKKVKLYKKQGNNKLFFQTVAIFWKIFFLFFSLVQAIAIFLLIKNLFHFFFRSREALESCQYGRTLFFTPATSPACNFVNFQIFLIFNFFLYC